MSNLRLVELDADNLAAAISIPPQMGEKAYVAPEQAKGRGVGRFAVEKICEEARRRGYDKITVLWEPSDDGPEQFYLKVGFERTGELFGETVGTLAV
jgi:diamine N-acetyltransferase